ncbi:MAG: DUF1934 domain-containing protein [Lachnospiraceae bacterium]|nr:DUF1934 domain-containing protein [Lachnospiraceae bacterium]
MTDGKVKIKVTGWQTTGGDSDTTVIDVEGTYEKDGDGCKVRYIEKPADDIEVENEVTASADKAIINKRGPINSDMIFVPGEVQDIEYQTPFGTIDMKAKCDSILFYEEESEVSIMISYTLYAGDRMMAYCKTLLEITPMKAS